MKNKNAMILPEETLKLIIGVIILIALLSLLAAIYYILTSDRDLELAEKSLENLLISLDSGQKETKIFNPTNWQILSWSVSENEQSNFPDPCPLQGKSCVCFCSNGECSAEKVCSSSNLQIEVGSCVTGLVNRQKGIFIDKPPITVLIQRVQSQGEEKIQLIKIEGGGVC